MNEMTIRDDENQQVATAPSVAPVLSNNGAVAIAQTRELAEALAAVQMAKAFPRNIQHSLQLIKNECMREHLADVAVYRYSRGGTDISGASIRLAETLVRCLGNIDAGWREIETTQEASKCEAFAWDKERNVRHSVTFTVSHIRHTKKGDYLLTDPRDIYEKCANEAARRKRACILAVVPGDIVDEAVATCEKTLLANVGEITTDRLKALIEKFAELSVTKEMIEKRIQRDITAITPAQFVDLGKVYNSIKDGIAKVNNFFDAEPPKVADNAKKQSAKSLRDKLAIGNGKEEQE